MSPSQPHVVTVTVLSRQRLLLPVASRDTWLGFAALPGFSLSAWPPSGPRLRTEHPACPSRLAWFCFHFLYYFPTQGTRPVSFPSVYSAHSVPFLSTTTSTCVHFSHFAATAGPAVRQGPGDSSVLSLGWGRAGAGLGQRGGEQGWVGQALPQSPAHGCGTWARFPS